MVTSFKQYINSIMSYVSVTVPHIEIKNVAVVPYTSTFINFNDIILQVITGPQIQVFPK